MRKDTAATAPVEASRPRGEAVVVTPSLPNKRFAMEVSQEAGTRHMAEERAEAMWDITGIATGRHTLPSTPSLATKTHHRRGKTRRGTAS